MNSPEPEPRLEPRNPRKVSRIAFGLLLLWIVFLVLTLREPLSSLVMTRPATRAELQKFLNGPHYLLSPTGWHAIPIAAVGRVHRFRDRPVGEWLGYYEGDVSSGWVQAEFQLDGTGLGGLTYYFLDGRVNYQAPPGGPMITSPPWRWRVQDLTAEEMAAVRESPLAP